jgi:hypothetical protein
MKGRLLAFEGRLPGTVSGTVKALTVWVGFGFQHDNDDGL